MAAPEPGAAPVTSCRRRPRWRRWLLLPAAIWLGLAVWHTHKPLPAGVHVAGGYVPVPPDSLTFLADVTALGADGRMQREQSIHQATLQLVRDAQDFLLVDFFLFNDQGGPMGPVRYGTGLAPVSRELTTALRELKQAQPQMPVLVLVDPINDYYRGSAPAELVALQALGIDVVVTRLDALRDSNPLYSATWRMLFGWWLPADGDGSLPNLLDGEGPRLRLGALLRLPNFKANHRKVVLTGDGAGSLVGIISSANPHDASSAHSNVALRLRGEALRPLLHSELAIARFSGWSGNGLEYSAGTAADAAEAPEISGTRTTAAILTEGAIRKALLARITRTRAGDAIDVAQFYLAERTVIDALVEAARRGVAVRVLLDPNRDAFGFEKSGIPNRPVGGELLRRSRQRIALRWFDTHGEQFHSKLAAVRSGGRLWLTLGSANFTRRNIGDYNLEANAAIDTPLASPAALAVQNWFEMLWSNAGGAAYSTDAITWAENGPLRYWQYRLMEATGLSTF